MLGFTFPSKFDRGSYIISIAKTASKKIIALISSMKFCFSYEVAVYLNKSTARLSREYCCHVWAGASSCYLELVDKLQKRSFTCYPIVKMWPAQFISKVLLY